MDAQVVDVLTKALMNISSTQREVAHLVVYQSWLLIAALVLVVAGLFMLWAVSRQLSVCIAIGSAVSDKTDAILHRLG